MHDADRYHLLGQYETPRFEYGQVVFCERFGEVEIVGQIDEGNKRLLWIG